MLLFRLGLLVYVLYAASERAFALSTAKISVQKATGKPTFLQLTSSGTEDRSAPSEQEEVQPQSSQFPRAAVSIALRCLCGDTTDPKAHYLLIRRGNEPNKGKWALPGGKLEWGEATLEGAKRELSEEVIFETSEESISSSFEIVWCPEPYAVADAIAEGFHYLIAVCFAECKLLDETNSSSLEPPRVLASDDATDARWWSMDEILKMEDNALVGTPGFVRRMKRTEFLYQQGVLSSDETIEI